MGDQNIIYIYEIIMDTLIKGGNYRSINMINIGANSLKQMPVN